MLKWFCSYCNDDAFTNHFPNSNCQKLPSLLSSNPDLVKDLNDYYKQNISYLGVELVYQYLNTTLIPKLVEKIKKERNDPSYSKAQLFDKFNFRKLTDTTTFRWMHLLGYQFKPRKKSYYVDNCKDSNNISYHNKFIECYFEYELCSFTLVCISAKERDEMVKNKEIDKELGYAFKSFGEMYEFHIDDHYKFQQKCESTPFGGFLSICKPPEKPMLFIFDQDECIFKQYMDSP